MSAITSYQPLEATSTQLGAVDRPPQKRWALLAPQEELCKNLVKLEVAQILVACVAMGATGIWGLSSNTYTTLNQVGTASFFTAIFTGLGTVSLWYYFFKSNKEKAEITPEMKIAIQNQVQLEIKNRLKTPE